ncbi:MAG: hypothetical protein PHW10_01275 [Candidatus Peribacteraceae bacterium]|nr:hypothetical protein [Candidatus Peribacteraceae bacterium]
MPTCKQCSSAFTVTPLEEELRAKMAPEFGGKRFEIPAPTLCPDCRQQRRLFWRNERTLYRRTCDACKKSIISVYPTKSAFPVYCTECWWSDKWDPRSFGRNVDFNRPFFPQINELQNVVPRLALNVVNNENSEFINLSGSNKNCYLLFAAEFNEDCLYGYQVIKSTGCIDAGDCTESQYCFEVTDVDKCHTVSFSQNCTNCSDSMFLFDCKGCADCLFSVNLRNKRFHIRNKPFTPAEYAKEKRALLQEMAKGGLPKMRQEFSRFKEQSIHRAREVVSCENVTGDYLKNSRNLQNCFDVSYGEDCANIFTGFQIKDLLDVCHTTDAQLGYESLSLGYGSYNAIFTHGSWGSKHLLYCDIVQSGSHMCGCVSMKPGKHCILNKQYTKEEYESLVPTVIEHMRSTQEWGEFFPAGISPFAYNETTAQQYFPLTEMESKSRGWPWREEETELPDVKKIIAASTLPTDITQVPDDILQWAIKCEATNRPFRIVKKELEFYRERGFPLPHFHPDERHRRRMLRRNPRTLWGRKCMHCGKEMQTTYAPERPEKVYCEECYLKEVY